MNEKKRAVPKINVTGHDVDSTAIPKAINEDMARLIYRCVRASFGDPDVLADYEKWLAQYRETHGQTN